MAAGVAYGGVRSGGFTGNSANQSTAPWGPGNPGYDNEQRRQADARSQAAQNSIQQQAGALGSGSGGSSPVSTLVTDTAVNPLEQGAHDDVKKYNSDLAGTTDDANVRNLNARRTEISTGLEAERQQATASGADTSFFLNRAAASGQRSLDKQQGELQDVANQSRQGGLALQASAAGGAAGGQRAQHAATQSAQLQQQRNDIERAATEARIREMPYDRLIRMSSMLGGSGVGVIA